MPAARNTFIRCVTAAAAVMGYHGEFPVELDYAPTRARGCPNPAGRERGAHGHHLRSWSGLHGSALAAVAAERRSRGATVGHLARASRSSSRRSAANPTRGSSCGSPTASGYFKSDGVRPCARRRRGDRLRRDVVLTRALQHYPGTGLVFTLPDGAPQEYPELLSRIALAAGATACSWVDEYQAVAAGYEYLPVAGEPFLIITFSGTGTEVTALIPAEQQTNYSGRKMRVLAKVTGTIGCRAIDSWIVRDLLTKFRLLESDPRAVRLAPRLQYEAERVRENIDYADELTVSLTDTVSGKSFTIRYTAADFNRVLTANGAIPALHDCIDRALSALRMWGMDIDRIRNVFLLGAGCTLPARAECYPFEVPKWPGPRRSSPRCYRQGGSGLCRTDTGTGPDHPLLCSSLLGCINTGTPLPLPRSQRHPVPERRTGSPDYHQCSLRWTDPSRHPHLRDGGTESHSVPEIELISDANGGVRLAGPTQEIDAKGKAIHANERSPTLLVATPPARKGEPRFECTFTIDAGRNLCVSARDLVTGALIKEHAPVHRLT